MENLTTIRERLNGVIREASADLRAIRFSIARRSEQSQREVVIAAALEDLSQDRRVQAAWRESGQRERSRMQRAIGAELAQSKPNSLHRAALLRLSRLVEQEAL